MTEVRHRVARPAHRHDRQRAEPYPLWQDGGADAERHCDCGGGRQQARVQIVRETAGRFDTSGKQDLRRTLAMNENQSP